MSEFRGKYRRWAVIAGASEGVGAAVADQAAGRGLDLILIARNEPLLNSVAADIGARHGVEARPLALDLTDPGLGARVAAATEGLEVGLVVYNAGAANRTRPFLEDSFADSLRQVQLACVGPLVLVHLFVPGMRDRGRGGIVLVGSGACLVGAANVVVYSAVKMFNVNLAEGLWAEFREHGVDVCCTPLGTVYTPALERMGVAFDPRRDLLPADAAREIIENIGNGPTHFGGDANRAAAARVWPGDRRAAVVAISAATQAFARQRVTGGLSALQLPDHLQGIVDVPADVRHRVEDVPDRAVAVDDVRDPAGDEAERRRHPVRLADLAALVGQQRERQLMVGRERGVPVDRVGADADHLGARIGEDLVAVAERACLPRAAAGLVLGVEVQDDHALPDPVLEPHLLTGLRWKGEVGCLVAHSDASRHLVPPFRRALFSIPRIPLMPMPAGGAHG